MNSNNRTDPGQLSDAQLVRLIEVGSPVAREIVDEYYRRCIPIYRDFLGSHWHTGYYRDIDQGVSARDQVRMIDYIAELAQLRPGNRILDVGCGIGAALCHLNQTWQCEAIGLTPVSEQQAAAVDLARSCDASIQVDIGHAETLPYPDNSFDAVLFFESSCHFSDRAAFFREAARVLKPGGRIVGEDWIATDLSNTSHRSTYIEPICKTWAIPMLGDAREYQQLMQSVQFQDICITDMRSIMPLSRGFTVSDRDLAELYREIDTCAEPLLALTLKGLAKLGEAIRNNAFTIACMSACKPDPEINRY